MVRAMALMVTALVLASAGRAVEPAKEPKKDKAAALEKLLHGVWQGGDCVGTLTIAADGTVKREHYTPGNNTATGTWEVRWDALPPTLVIVAKTSDDPDLAGKTWEFKLVQLDDDALAYQHPDARPGSEPVHFNRVKK
ncbi:hypothetical protein [Limnoglobus roseus]|uniref:TIGR03067 domain-containing protein n=1 Tax=Limnoglobus roseus TaxID=2598579 RepID=A0A5C1AMD2_9BACT|nr:hypothetical protein [Limnoglobus roseus]QEL18354.1 hypothetical protein PX52LOC_05375 [Limnoglobus roseus]